MIRVSCLAALILLTVPGSTQADDDPTGGQPLAERVNRAVDAGVRWMRSQQREDGTFPLSPPPAFLRKDPSEQWAGGPWSKGFDALCVYTFAACDIGVDDQALVRGFHRLRAHWRGRRVAHDRTPPPASGDGISTYFVSLCLLALDAAYNRTAAPLRNGPREAGKKHGVPLSKEDRAWAEELVAWLRRAQDPGVTRLEPTKKTRRGRKKPTAPVSQPPSHRDGGGFGYESPGRPKSTQDLSNSQFALLGLKSAARLGIGVPTSMWLRSLRHYLVAQETDGPRVPRVEAADAANPHKRRSPTDPKPPDDMARGWAYRTRGSKAAAVRTKGGPSRGATLSMTTGGVSSLVICRSELVGVSGYTPDLAARTEKGIRDALAWIAQHLAELDKPGNSILRIDLNDPRNDLYFQYGLERACVLGGVRTLTGRDWYKG